MTAGGRPAGQMPCGAAGRRRAFWDFVSRQPLVPAAVAAAAGVALADCGGGAQLWAWVFAAGVCLAVFFWRPSRGRALPVVAVLFAVLHAARLADVPEIPGHLRGTTSLVGTVTDVPERSRSGRTTHFTMRCDPGGGRPRSNRHTLKVDVRVRGDVVDTVRAGDRIRATGRLAPAAPPRNPGGFDLPSHLARHGLAGRFSVSSGDAVEVIGRTDGALLTALAARCRAWLSEAITGRMEDGDAAVVIRAMVLGARDQAPPELEQPFRLSGTMHLFAISGLHVGIFSSIVWFVFKLCGMRRGAAAALIIPLVFFYAFVTGWRPSAVRAAIMLSVFLLGIATDRHPRLVNSLAAAALIILATDSHQLFLPGFQLSFLVLLAIGLVAGPLARPLQRWGGPDAFLPRQLLTQRQRLRSSFTNWLSAGLAVSTAAWLGSLLPLWWHFGLVTPVAVVANIVLVPFAYAILSLAAASAATAPLPIAGGGLTGFFQGFNAWLAGSVVAIASWFADLPLAHFQLPKRFIKAPYEVAVLDTGFGGSSSVVSARGGDAWLIDTGSAFAFSTRVHRFLQHGGTDRVEGAFLTHADSQHVGGASELIGTYGPRVLYTSAHAARSTPFKPIVQAAEGRLHTAARGDRIAVSTGCRLDVLYPPADQLRGVADDSTLVLRLQVADWRVLFVSDSGFATEKALMESGTDLTADVLIMGRHRADASATPAFIDAVAPRAIVATNARFPVFEAFPVAARRAIADRGIPLFDQATTGAVTIGIYPEKIVVRGFMDGQRLVIAPPRGTPKRQ